MVRNRRVETKMLTSFYVEPGQSLKSTKSSGKKLVLTVPRCEYNRFVEYTTESERMAIIAAKEKAKVAALRKATYEMSKNWDNTNENVKKRRQEELLARRKKEDDIRMQFAKEMSLQNEAARAKVVEEARRLLLYQKPLCRLLNGALLTSECFRERDAQLEFEKTLKGVDEEQEKEYAEFLKQQAEAFKKSECQKTVERIKKTMAYGAELKKQISDNEAELKRAEKEEYLLGRQDLLNMARDLRLMKECEEEEALKRKNELRKLVTDAVEEKKNFEKETKREMEFRDQAAAIFERSKRRMEQIRKLKAQEELAAKMRHAEFIGKKFAAASAKKKADDEDARIAKAQREIEARDLAEIEAKKQRGLEAKMECIKFQEDAENEKRMKNEEAKELNNWEMLQRFKRDEFNKEFQLNQRKLDWEKKMATARDLKEQMLENEKSRIREKKFESDENSAAAIIERTNKKVLEYGEQILEESRGVRPLFPILKTIEKFKKDNGLLRKEVCEENSSLVQNKKPRRRLPVCLAPVPEQEIVYI